MIVVKLKGGLANQMFQYALGRQISLKNDVPLYLDIVHYQKEQTKEKTIREFGLNVCNIQAEVATKKQINNAKGWFTNPVKRKINLGLNRLKPYYKSNVIKEQKPSFDGNILRAPANCYIDGFWQSQKYFSSIRNVLLEDLSFKSDASLINSDYLQQIKSCNSVSIHVRRGDYVNSKHYQNVHQVLNTDYYDKAIKIISEKVENPIFYIFSDDPEWVKKHIKIGTETFYIDHNQGAAHEDLRLMQNCKHNIIANSTFSWWGAWLNTNNNKIVIAPETWYKMEQLENSDIAPSDWIKIKNT